MASIDDYEFKAAYQRMKMNEGPGCIAAVFLMVLSFLVIIPVGAAVVEFYIAAVCEMSWVGQERCEKFGKRAMFVREENFKLR